MWTNGMMHLDNPLSCEELDAAPNDMETYGYDAQGPSTIDNNNEVVVEPMDFPYADLLESFVLGRVDPLKQSTEMGDYVYIEALNLEQLKLSELND
jgi:hypothetical protein